MLTIARVGQLNTLNFSCITPKERLNAEIYYLSSIAKELSLHPEDQASFIVARHPRYSELCEEYGEPVIERNNSSINPNSLAARLITFNFHLGESARALVSGGISAEFSAELPKNFTVYNALGTVGKRTGLPPLKLRLFWETGEFDPVAKVAHDYNDLLGWKSENEEDEDEDGTESIPAFVPREVELLAGTRLVGTWVDAKVASVRVEVNDMVLM
jgi:tubulin-specific chaperone E